MENAVKEGYFNVSLKHSKIIRGPYQMSIDITNKCNLRCLHCYNDSGNNCVVEDEMSDEEFLNLIEDVITMKPLNVCLCGGEPLLRKELLLESIRRLSKSGINTALVSNGLLLDKKAAKELKDAGLDQIQISIDGMEKAHDRLRKRKGAFKKAVEALKNVADEKIRMGIAFAPTAWNVEDIEEVFELARSLGVSELRTQYLMEIGRGSENSKSICPTNAQYRLLLKKLNVIKQRCIDEGYSIFVDFGDPIEHLVKFTEEDFACSTYISIKANGAIIPSMYLPVSVGNVRRNKLSDYWKAGLSRVWRIELLRKIANEVRSISSMNNIEGENLPVTFKEKDIEIDILNEDYLKEVSI